jgi:hypothetical protein
LLNAANESIKRFRSRVKNTRWAIVAGPIPAEANQFASYLEKPVGEIWVFEELDGAAQWLGHDPRVVDYLVSCVRYEVEK